MRRRVRGRPLLVVTMAATITACGGEPDPGGPDGTINDGGFMDVPVTINDGGRFMDVPVPINDGGFFPDSGASNEDAGAEEPDSGSADGGG